MPFDQLPGFLQRLRERQAVAPLALEFTILTAARTGETLGAVWSEINLEQQLWTIPAARMKAGREHRVPLTLRLMEILGVAFAARTGDHVFPV